MTTTARKREPITPPTPEQREHYRTLPGWIVLARPPGATAFKGYVERSWSMDWSATHVCMFWTGTGRSFLGTHTVDGERVAKHHLEEVRRARPDWSIEAYDARSEELPIVLDWEKWIDAQAFDPNTFSGVTDKFKARNVPFTMKG